MNNNRHIVDIIDYEDHFLKTPFQKFPRKKKSKIQNFDQNDYSDTPSDTYSTDSDNSLQQLKNNKEIIMKEIESQEEVSSIGDICDIERELIEMEARELSDLKNFKIYFKKVCTFYSEKVSILMREIHQRLQDVPKKKFDISLDKIETQNIKIREFKEKISEMGKRAREMKQEVERSRREMEEQMEVLENHEIVMERLKALEIENTQLKKLKLRIEENEQRLKDYQDKMRIVEGVVNYDSNIVEKFDFEEVVLWEEKLSKAQEMLKQKKDKLCREIMYGDSSKFNKCIVCRERTANILLKPCNHLCLCEVCGKNIAKCPFDRKMVISKEKVYLG